MALVHVEFLRCTSSENKYWRKKRLSNFCTEQEQGDENVARKGTSGQEGSEYWHERADQGAAGAGRVSKREEGQGRKVALNTMHWLGRHEVRVAKTRYICTSIYVEISVLDSCPESLVGRGQKPDFLGLRV